MGNLHVNAHLRVNLRVNLHVNCVCKVPLLTLIESESTFAGIAHHWQAC